MGNGISLLTHPLSKAIISSLILGLTLVLYNIAMDSGWYGLILLGGLSLNGIYVYASEWETRKLSRDILMSLLNRSVEDVLKLLISSVWPGKYKIRANVMLLDPQSGKLKIEYSLHMNGFPDRFKEFKPGEGCSGMAFKENFTYAVDLDQATHEDYGMRKKDIKDIWKEMRAILSVPILDLANHRPVGVLNVDSDLHMNEVGFNTDSIQESVAMYADIIARILAKSY